MCFLCFGFYGWAQARYSYYLVEEKGSSLEPQSKSTNPDGTLSIVFSNSSLNIYFQNKTVYEYEKGFPNESSAYLQRVYKVTLDNSTYLPELQNLDNVEHAEQITEGEELFEPNDYYYINSNSARKQLELIRAPKAWDITQGDSSIVVGIIDSRFEPVHEDLNGKFVNIIDDFPSGSDHGIKVAGMIAANTNNLIGVASVGFNTKMLGMANGLSATEVAEMSNIPGVKIINASWHNGTCQYSIIEQEIFSAVRQKNILVVAAAGNGGTCGGPDNYVYPASYDDVLSVSSVGHRFTVGTNVPGYGEMEWSDVHEMNIGDPDSAHQHNDKVDIVAPGYGVNTTKENNTYGITWGTSLSSPMVAGAAALVWSVKPSLTADEIEGILKSTADDIFWIPYNQPYIGKLGSGRLNVFRAVKTVECMDETNPVVELVVRDSNEDTGNEPNNQSSIYWNSNDIWVRNQDDGRYDETHQEVEYSLINPNYVYVRVTNYGCQTSSGNDEVDLYWSYAATSQPWPGAWDGTSFIPPIGGPIGTATVPALAPGQETVLEFEWYPPNPANAPSGYDTNFSLLARLNSTDDPISFTNGSNINNYVARNNNVAWKNVNVVDAFFPKSQTKTSLLVSNPTEDTQTYSIELLEKNASNDKKLFEEAEVGIKMDSILYNSWVDGGRSIADIDSTRIQNIKRISGNSPQLENITLEPDEVGTIELSFNFLTKELTDKESYKYDIIQRNESTGEIVGGATIIINKENREAFLADAEATQNSNSTTLIAENIGESAVYNWYDAEGNLVYTGTEITVSPEITKTYKLEIISDLDGFKDYKEVEVSGNSPYSLDTLVPNPVSSQVTISYDASSATSAYLVITNTITAGSENYILDTNANQININLSAYSDGIYTVTLVCDDAIVDSKNLIKN